MSLFSTLLAIATFISFIAGIFFVIFGQVTVRKLRKNPETKSKLGVEFVSGWDILNVAKVLTIPHSWNRRLQKSRLAFLLADVDLLYQYTTTFDRVLARIFYVTYSIAGLSLIILVILNSLNIFD